MSARRNPPSFVLIEKATGFVVYTKRATGVGNEAIAACVKKGRELAYKTGKTYFVFLDIGGLRIGSKVNVPGAYAMGITEEIRPSTPSAVMVREKSKDCPHCGMSYIGTPQMHKFECPPQGGRSLYRENSGRVRKNIFTFNNPRNYYSKGVRDAVNDAVKRHFQLHGERISGGAIAKMLKRTDNLILAHELTPFNAAHQALIEHLRGLPGRGGVRENIFTFNNPSGGDTQVEAAARAAGLSVATWAPGDGVTRYRFFLAKRGEVHADYHQGDGIYTSLGRKDALNFVRAFGLGKGPKANPLTRKESANLLSRARSVHQRSKSQTQSVAGKNYLRGVADGLTRAVSQYGPRGAQQAVGSMWARTAKSAIRSNACPNPIIRGDKLPEYLKQEVLRAYVHRWTIGNEQRAAAYGFCPHCKTPGGKPSETNIACRQFHPTIPLQTDAEWLRAHAFHVTKNGKLDARHHHAEPDFMAEENPRRARKNPYSIVKEFGKGSKGKAAAEKYLRENLVDLQKSYYDLCVTKLPMSGGWGIVAHLVRLRTNLVRSNPLLQTVFAANPPVSVAWNAMTRRQREALLEIVGYDRDYQGGMTSASWSSLPAHAKRKLEAQWLDTTSSGGTTKRRRVPVAVNPLTKREAAAVLRDARGNIRHAQIFRGGHTRSSQTGAAQARATVVHQYGPRRAERAATKIFERAGQVGSGVRSNPGVRLPKPGTRLTIAEALDLAQKIGNRELVKQCHAAMKLQKAANKNAKCVIWKVFPMGSSDKIDQVVALTHYGDSPETMYRPPKGSKKGPHMYRHKWGEGGGGKKTVPLLASPDGKMLMMPLEGRKVASDWLRH